MHFTLISEVGSTTGQLSQQAPQIPQAILWTVLLVFWVVPLGTAIFLASSDSDFITGQVLCVDGGSVTH